MMHHDHNDEQAVSSLQVPQRLLEDDGTAAGNRRPVQGLRNLHPYVVVSESSSSDDDDSSVGTITTTTDKQQTSRSFNHSIISFDTYPQFGPENKSLTAKYLTREVFHRLKDKKTSKGCTLSHAIQDGVVHQHLTCGATAGDEECWEIFKELYYPIIYSLHGHDAYTQKHDATRADLDPSKLKVCAHQESLFREYVASTRVRAARNIRGFSLPSGATADQERARVEAILVRAFAAFRGELAGTYYPLAELDDATMQSLVGNGFLFQTPSDRNLITGGAAGAARSWPESRGIFHNESKTALAWVNEEDHCRIISMEWGGNIRSVFARFRDISNQLKIGIEASGHAIMWNETLGYLATCPTNLGTGLRASFMVELVHFHRLRSSRKEKNNGSCHGEDNKEEDLLHHVCARLDLQVRGSRGEHSSPAAEDEDDGARFDISNKQRIGQSEVQLVQKLIDGVTKVIYYEQLLASGKTPSDVRAHLESE